VYSCFMEIHLTTTECHLPYSTTQSPKTSEQPRLNPSRTGQYLLTLPTPEVPSSATRGYAQVDLDIWTKVKKLEINATNDDKGINQHCFIASHQINLRQLEH